jgi:hypothetical protein
LVAGRATSGAAVIGLDDPICGVVGTVTTCAEASAANAEKIATAVTDLPNTGEEVIFMGFPSRTCEDAA